MKKIIEHKFVAFHNTHKPHTAIGMIPGVTPDKFCNHRAWTAARAANKVFGGPTINSGSRIVLTLNQIQTCRDHGIIFDAIVPLAQLNMFELKFYAATGLQNAATFPTPSTTENNKARHTTQDPLIDRLAYAMSCGDITVFK